MNKTKIEWCDYTINPVKGLCPMACPYCYARRMYNRFKWNPEIRFDIPSFLPLLETMRRKPSRIFVGSTMELFGEWVKPEWMHFIFERVRMLEEHTFIFLTKQPQNLKQWSPFPKNCWVGCSVTSNGTMTLAMTNLAYIKAGQRFISFEPLLGDIGMSDHMSMKGIIDWVILGSRTQPTRHPDKLWVTEIIDAADRADIPVFVKEPLANYMNIHRQEYPVQQGRG